MIDHIVRSEARSYLEVGCRYGDTFHSVVSAMPKGSVAVAVDLPGDAWGRSDSLAHLESAIADLTAGGYDASLIIGDSRALGTRQAVMLRGPYDAVFLDGDHRYAGVLADWDNYSRSVTPSGFVGLHDIDAHYQRKHMKVDVPVLWRELKQRYDYVEVVGTQRGMGIGIVWPGKPR